MKLISLCLAVAMICLSVINKTDAWFGLYGGSGYGLGGWGYGLGGLGWGGYSYPYYGFYGKRNGKILSKL
jgi:hypothetical protein